MVFTQRLNSKQKNHEQHQQQNCCKVENPRRGEERKGNEKEGREKHDEGDLRDRMSTFYSSLFHTM